MAKNYVENGDIIQFTATADIASGDVVVMGETLGVALVDIATGDSGSVQLRGVFSVPKVNGAVIKQGESLTYDVSAKAFDDNAATPATGDVTGSSAFAFETPASAATSMLVMFTGVPGTVT